MIRGERRTMRESVYPNVFGDAHVRESHRVLDDSYAPDTIRMDSSELLLDIHHRDVDHHCNSAEVENFCSDPACLIRKETHND
jgi:hypothetical protein